jgi:hypothetical protein
MTGWEKVPFAVARCALRHCDVLQGTPRFSGLARLADGRAARTARARTARGVMAGHWQAYDP